MQFLFDLRNTGRKELTERRLKGKIEIMKRKALNSLFCLDPDLKNLHGSLGLDPSAGSAAFAIYCAVI